MTYETLGRGALDYAPCRYGTSKLLFRGPKKKLGAPFVAFLGGTETYGKFIENPFPDLLQDRLGKPCINFGCVNAGVDVYLNDPFIVDACSNADVTVVQATGAHNMSNRFYSVHPRRNDRFVKASGLLQTIYRDVDFTDFNFNRHLLSTLQEISEERFEIVRNEIREAWVARMELLATKLTKKTVLLWFADHAPGDETEASQDDLGDDPLFVTAEMIERLKPYFTSYVCVVPSPIARAAGSAGMLHNQLEAPLAENLPGVQAHEEVVRALAPEIERLCA